MQESLGQQGRSEHAASKQHGYTLILFFGQKLKNLPNFQMNSFVCNQGMLQLIMQILYVVYIHLLSCP